MKRATIPIGASDSVIVERYMERSRRDVFDEVRQTAQVNEAARRDFDEVAIRGKLGVLAIIGKHLVFDERVHLLADFVLPEPHSRHVG